VHTQHYTTVGQHRGQDSVGDRLKAILDDLPDGELLAALQGTRWTGTGDTARRADGREPRDPGGPRLRQGNVAGHARDPARPSFTPSLSHMSWNTTLIDEPTVGRVAWLRPVVAQEVF